MSEQTKLSLEIRIRKVSRDGKCEADVIVPKGIQVVFTCAPPKERATIHYQGEPHQFGELFDLKERVSGDIDEIKVTWEDGSHGVPSPRFPSGAGN